VANGKKMMPSRGISHVLKAAATSAGQIQPVEAFASTSSVNNSEGFFQL
jgi:hypothetical protein